MQLTLPSPRQSRQTVGASVPQNPSFLQLWALPPVEVKSGRWRTSGLLVSRHWHAMHSQVPIRAEAEGHTFHPRNTRTEAWKVST